MKRATHSNTHSNTHRNTHSGKFPETSLATTSQPISQETSQETSQAQLRGHLLRLAKFARLIRTMGYSGSDVPGRASGLASRFLRDRCRLGEYESVVPVGSTSIFRTSRTSSSLPSVRTRSCMVGGCTGLPTRRRNATLERDSGASRPATGRSTPSRLTTRWAGRLPRHSMRSTCPSAFPSLTPPADRPHQPADRLPVTSQRHLHIYLY
jgi:hypothetical protein